MGSRCSCAGTCSARSTPTGIRTRDGVERPIDAVVPAVGYRMAFDPVAYAEKPVHGRDGFELGHHFATERLRAYQGISMPGLPNGPARLPEGLDERPAVQRTNASLGAPLHEGVQVLPRVDRSLPVLDHARR
jgi:hypothetical protein